MTILRKDFYGSPKEYLELHKHPGPKTW